VLEHLGAAGGRVARILLARADGRWFPRCAAQVVHVVKKSTGAHYAMKVQAKDTLVET
jgi:hypothetical protein